MTSDLEDSISLSLLAAHAAGDFLLQTDDMAAKKLDDPIIRATHVSTYTACFLPVAIALDLDRRQMAVFVGGIWATHFGIDSRRWNDAVPIWYDQALHVIALAIVVALTKVVRRD